MTVWDQTSQTSQSMAFCRRFESVTCERANGIHAMLLCTSCDLHLFFLLATLTQCYSIPRWLLCHVHPQIFAGNNWHWQPVLSCPDSRYPGICHSAQSECHMTHDPRGVVSAKQNSLPSAHYSSIVWLSATSVPRYGPGKPV